MTATENTSAAAGRMRVFIVDDHPVLRRGIKLLIDDEPDLVVCGEAESAGQAMREIGTCDPDIVVVDISLKDSDGLDLVRDLSGTRPGLPTLILSAQDETRYAERALRAGARGYVMKEQDIEVLVSAIRTVLDGSVHLSPDMTSKVLGKLGTGAAAIEDDERDPVDRLSPREREVFEMLGQGLPTRDIAERLHISPKTAQVHRENIKRKLGLQNATELQRAAFTHMDGVEV